MWPSRREFIRGCCAAASMGVFASFSRFGLMNALAQSPADYRALVCIFLFGGNDGNNLVVPMGSTAPLNYATYLALRGDPASGGLALAQSGTGALLGINIRTAQNGVRDFGLHPALTNIRNLFMNNRVAIVANVGVLFEPLTRNEYRNRLKPIPANLFSHSDQQQQWQTLRPDGFGTTGWGGRTADKVQGLNVGAQFPPITTVAGTAIFNTGQETHPFALVPGTTPGLQGFDSSAAANARLVALQEMLTFDTGINLVQATSSVTGRALQQSATLSAALQGQTLQTAFPATSIGNQLRQVALIIKVRQALGLSRQIFFCSMGGYDTHSNQLPDQQNLLSQLDAAMKAFYDATLELGVSSRVTTFTLSEFGRTLKPASGAGSDHGWGSHQLILGDAVLGGDMYGRFPEPAFGGPDDASSNGRWIPSTSIDQFGATLARWFGVAEADLPAVFPNLPKFPTSNLGFMG